MTGFECAPDYLSNLKPGRFPLVLRNLLYPAVFLNGTLMLLVFAVSSQRSDTSIRMLILPGAARYRDFEVGQHFESTWRGRRRTLVAYMGDSRRVCLPLRWHSDWHHIQHRFVRTFDEVSRFDVVHNTSHASWLQGSRAPEIHDATAATNGRSMGVHLSVPATLLRSVLHHWCQARSRLSHVSV